MAENLFQELKDALAQFKTFLHDNATTIKPVIVALKPLVPQIGELLNKLIELMNKLKTTIQNLNVGAIPGLDKVSQFTTAVTTVLHTAQALLPQQAPDIQKVLDAASVVTSLPSFDQLKAEIITLLNDIIGELTNLNS
ncbi:MAG: hypothetical protein WCE79_13085 [Xanthobacteraceae bacterium]